MTAYVSLSRKSHDALKRLAESNGLSMYEMTSRLVSGALAQFPVEHGRRCPVEQAEVSLHQVKVFACVAAANRWMSNAEIAQASGVAPRTARLHTQRLVGLGIFDQAELFPRHGFRLSAHAKNRNAAYLLRLEQAQGIFASMEGQ